MKYSLEKYLEVLYKTDGNGNITLEDNEYIRIYGRNEDRSFNHYVRTIEEIREEIRKYGQVYNLYIGLGTVRGQSGTAENVRARQVLMLDFDKKDYPELKTAQDFTALFKSKLPEVFVHMIVDSGRGYHFYIAINRCVDIERVAAINKALAEITGADEKAALPTQLARIPTSFNLKDRNNRKPVNIIINALERSPQTFKSYHLQKIEGIIERIRQNEKNLETASPLPSKKFEGNSSYYCCEAMLSQGVEEGERNFALGRITKYLQDIKGYTLENALKTVQEWNRRCRPPKSPIIVEADFRSYWDGDYKLLSCRVPNETDQAILNRYCNKYQCNSVFEETANTELKATEMFFDNNILRNNIVKDLTGFHLLILSILDFANMPLKKKDLVSRLTGRRTKKCCISDNTLRKVLEGLIEKKYVIYDDFDKTYAINRKSYKPTYTKYSYSASIQFINKIISPREYVVYLLLVRNLQQNKNVTYETLAEDMRISEGHIGEYIKGLHEAGLINVYKNYNEKGLLHNVYSILY